MHLLPEWETDPFWAYAGYPHRQFLLPNIQTFIEFMVDYFGPHPFWGAEI